MQSQILLTPTSPVLGDQDIGPVQRVAEEMSDRHERDRILKPNPFWGCPRGPAFRHSVAVFADINAVEGRIAANYSAQSHHYNEVGRVHAARSGLGNDDDGDGHGAGHAPVLVLAGRSRKNSKKISGIIVNPGALKRNPRHPSTNIADGKARRSAFLDELGDALAELPTNRQTHPHAHYALLHGDAFWSTTCYSHASGWR